MTPRRYPPRSTTLYDPATEMPRPVVGLDIDGTLGVYHRYFLQFAEGWLGKELDMAYDGSVSLSKWMGVSKERYRRVKMAYRRGGLKRNMPVYSGAPELAQGLRKAGAEIIICTTRPFLMYENVDSDTQEWLRRNRIQHDNVLHGEHKYRDLARRYGDRVIMTLEDLPELCEQALMHNCRPVQIVRPHNWDGRIPAIPTVNSLHGALALGLTRIVEYEKEHK